MSGGGTGGAPGGAGGGAAGGGAPPFSNPYSGETTTHNVIVPATYPRKKKRPMEHPHWRKDAVQRRRMDSDAAVAHNHTKVKP
jgi:hypothetical protein